MSYTVVEYISTTEARPQTKYLKLKHNFQVKPEIEKKNYEEIQVVEQKLKKEKYYMGWGWAMVLSATFNNISVISFMAVSLLVEETGKNH